MRLYQREDFIQLPALTVYSRMAHFDNKEHELQVGLFCKVSGTEYAPDWVEQDLIGESGRDSNTMGKPTDPFVLRDQFKDFRTDLDCAGRDGMFDSEDLFIVWDKQDLSKLISYLTKCHDSI